MTFAHTGKVTATAAVVRPPGWPPQWPPYDDDPGDDDPVYPPGYPDDIPGTFTCSITILANISTIDDLDTEYKILDDVAAPASAFLNQISKVTMTTDGAGGITTAGSVVKMKKAAPDTFAVQLFYNITKYDGANFGFDETIILDIDSDYEDDTLTMTIVVDSVETPTVSCNATVKIVPAGAVDAREFESASSEYFG